MDCKEIREYLLTDYRDAMAKSDVADAVRRHLESCAACREFEHGLDIALKPFADVSRARPPQDLWEKIRQRVEPKESFWRTWVRDAAISIERFIEFLHMPRYVLASVAAAVVIIAVFTAKTRMVQREDEGLERYLGDQASFIQEGGVDDPLNMDFLSQI